MKKILLFPGAFNPPHKGHIELVRAATKQDHFDEVWIMPSGNRDDGKVISIDYDHRRKLSTLFVKELQEILDIPVVFITAELDDTEGVKTFEYIRRIKETPDTEILQLIGSDAYENLLHHNLILEEEKFLIFRRAGSEIKLEIRKGDEFFSVELPFISSTMVRALVHENNAQYRKLVTEEIADYIESKNLYK